MWSIKYDYCCHIWHSDMPALSSMTQPGFSFLALILDAVTCDRLCDRCRIDALWWKVKSLLQSWNVWIWSCTCKESDCICQIHDRSIPFHQSELFNFEFSKDRDLRQWFSFWITRWMGRKLNFCQLSRSTVKKGRQYYSHRGDEASFRKPNYFPFGSE